MAVSLKQTFSELKRAQEYISNALICLRAARPEHTNLVDSSISAEVNGITCDLRKVNDRIVQLKEKIR